METNFYKMLLSFVYLTVFIPVGVASTFITETSAGLNMRNDSVSVTFSPKGTTFDIISLRLDSDKELVKPGENTTPWTLSYLGTQGERPELIPRLADYKGYVIENSNSVIFTWNTHLNYDSNTYCVNMRVFLPDDSSLLYWDITATVPNGWTVTKSSFPSISIISPINGKIVTSGGWGNEFDIKPQGNYEANYPSWNASMQLIMTHNSDGSFYYSPQDYNACGKMMRATEKEGIITVTTEVTTSYSWTKDNIFTLPWNTVIGYSPNGWQYAALKWYRPFALSTDWGKTPLIDRDIPTWLVEKDLWLRAKYLDKNTVAAVNRAIDYYGEGICFHWYFWHNHLYDSHYPDYFPANPAFAPIIKKVRARNCEVIPYINGRLWDPADDSYITLNGKNASCRRLDGTLYTEVYPTSKVPNTVTCPSSPIWNKIIIDLADRIQNELGTNGLYIDQIAAASPYPCYANNHPHPKGGGEFWYHSYRDLIARMRAHHLKKGNIIFSEENGECYIPSFDILLTVNTPHGRDCRIVPLFPLVYSDRTLTCAYTYSPYTDVTQGEFRYQNMQCFLYGSQLGWVDPRLLWVNDSSDYEAAFLRTLVRFRSQQHDVFIGGRYLEEIIPTGDNPMIDVHTFGLDYVVKAARWMSSKGKQVIYVVNSDSKPHCIILPDGKTIEMEAVSVKRINI